MMNGQRGSRSLLRREPARRSRPSDGETVGVVALGLTGGIGAGKSTALALFRELGAITVSADDLVHELYARPFVAAEIEARFGPEVLDSQGAVDRSRLAESVRGRRRELRWLEKLIHPLVEEEIEKAAEKKEPAKKEETSTATLPDQPPAKQPASQPKEAEQKKAVGKEEKAPERPAKAPPASQPAKPAQQPVPLPAHLAATAQTPVPCQPGALR
jgi:hypothetical protein